MELVHFRDSSFPSPTPDVVLHVGFAAEKGHSQRGTLFPSDSQWFGSDASVPIFGAFGGGRTGMSMGSLIGLQLLHQRENKKSKNPVFIHENTDFFFFQGKYQIRNKLKANKEEWWLTWSASQRDGSKPADVVSRF